MRLFGLGWQNLLEGYFDHTVTFCRPIKRQDSTGQQTDEFEIVGCLTNVACAVGDRRSAKTSNTQSSYGTEDAEVRILISGAHPEIRVGWKAVLDHMESEPYVVQECVFSQSADVSEISVGRWH